jgi:hypothetical protein
MNIEEINHAGEHIEKNCKCIYCKARYEFEEIQVVATTSTEGLFEAYCKNCGASTLVSVLVAPEMEIKEQNASRNHSSISENEVLDMKNFLSEFNGDFSKFIKFKK